MMLHEFIRRFGTALSIAILLMVALIAWLRAGA
jgi:hypothetical protein